MRLPDEKEVDFLVSRRFPGWNGALELRLPTLSSDFTLPADADATLLDLIAEFDLREDFREPKRGNGNLPRPSTQELRDWIDSFIAYRVSLETMDWHEFRAIYRAERKLWEAEAALKRAEEDRYQFFNEPEASEKLEDWYQMGSWSIEEAIALSMDKNPHIVSSKTLGPRSGSSFVKLFRKRLDAANRAVAGGQLSEPTTPSAFVRWAKTKSTFSGCFKYFSPEKEIEIREAKTKIDPREVTSLYKIIIGMAVNSYGFTPTESGLLGSRLFRQLQIDFKKYNINLNADTIRTHLEKAIADSLPTGGAWDDKTKRFKKEW